MSNDDCDCENNEPEFVLSPAIGTQPCPEEGAPATTPCDPDACCNYFRTEEAQGSNNFIFSAGGPFLFDTNTRLLAPAPGYIDPGPLDGIVCVDLPPGTYKVEVRVKLIDGSGGQQVDTAFNALVFPDCEDDSVAYEVAVCEGLDQTCSGFLYIATDGCQPGFELYGCGAIENLEVVFSRISGRTVVDCGGSNLLPADTSLIGTTCGIG